MPADPASCELARLLAIAIADGECDPELERVMGAIRARRGVLAAERQAQTAARVTEGARVRLARVRPLYLDGATGTVVGRKRNGRIQVKLDHPIGRFSDEVGCTLDMLEMISGPATRETRVELGGGGLVATCGLCGETYGANPDCGFCRDSGIDG